MDQWLLMCYISRNKQESASNCVAIMLARIVISSLILVVLK
jgi:hypothetical protein